MQDISQLKHTVSILPLFAAKVASLQDTAPNGAEILRIRHDENSRIKLQRINPVEAQQGIKLETKQQFSTYDQKGGIIYLNNYRKNKKL